MPLDLQSLLATDHMVSLILHVLRAGAFVSVLPLFGIQRDSRMLRFMLAVSMGGIFFWMHPSSIQLEGGSAVSLVILVVRELVIGASAGLACTMLSAMLTSAGEIISFEMGFGMARAMDPATGRSSTVVSQLFLIFGYLLVFQLDFHHDILRLLDGIYHWIPVGSAPDMAAIYEGLKTLISQSLEFALQYALPVLAVMLLLTATLIVLARAVQNINLLEFSFALRILLALLATSFFLTSGFPFLAYAFESLLERAAMTFGG